jgi:hypothetical protein
VGEEEEEEKRRKTGRRRKLGRCGEEEKAVEKGRSWFHTRGGRGPVPCNVREWREADLRRRRGGRRGGGVRKVRRGD